MLPSLPNPSKIKKAQTITFSGINRQPNAPDGAIFNTTNMDSLRMPCLAPRKKRKIIHQSSTDHYGIYPYNGGLIWVHGSMLLYNDKDISPISSGMKKIAAMNDWAIIYPDKKIYYLKEIDDEPVEYTETFTDTVNFQDGTLNGEAAEKNTIRFSTLYLPNTDLRPGMVVSIVVGSGDPENFTIQEVGLRELRFEENSFTNQQNVSVTITRTYTEESPNVGFITEKPMDMEVTASASFVVDTLYETTIESTTVDWRELPIYVGDCITISGSTVSENNRDAIIRGIDKVVKNGVDVYRIIVDDNIFTAVTGQNITVSRHEPDMDGFFVHENRLWGWKGKTIYASAFGDPRNFSIYEGLESDSWSLDVEGFGEIVGGISYQGYPTFFTETCVYRIYGDRPTQYRLMQCGHIGLERGSADSLAIAGEALYYLSPSGMARFSGGYSQNVHAPFGELKFKNGKAASDGIRYMINMQLVGDTYQTYVYDTRWDAWFRFDGDQYRALAADNGIYMMTAKSIMRDGNAPNPTWLTPTTETAAVSSEVEFNDFTGNYWTAGRGYGNPSRKGTSKLLLRMSISANTSVTVSICFDQGTWKDIKTLVGPTSGGAKMKSYNVPITPRRSDNYRIRLSCPGGGDWTLHSLVREEYSGSDIH